MTDYLGRLKALRSKTPIPNELSKLPKGSSVPFGSFDSDTGLHVLENQGEGRALEKAYGGKLPKLSEGSTWVDPQLRRALVRELWPIPGERTFLLDTSVRAKASLLEQVPEDVDQAAWREVVLSLSSWITGRIVGGRYDDQPIITLKTGNWV